VISRDIVDRPTVLWLARRTGSQEVEGEAGPSMRQWRPTPLGVST